MARIRVVRDIAADPTSAALLLAGPAALELWPGLRRTGAAADHVPAEVTTWRVSRPVRVAVRALPPRRTPTSYVSRFEVAGDDLPATRGLLTLDYAADGTHAVLRLDYEAVLADRIRVGALLRAMAEEFLANLAAAAEDRSFAA